MTLETWVQSQVMSYQGLRKWYLILPCLTLSNIRYVSRVKWSNSGKGLAPSPTRRCSSHWKRRLLVTLDYGCQRYFLTYCSIHILTTLQRITHLSATNPPSEIATTIYSLYIYILGEKKTWMIKNLLDKLIILSNFKLSETFAEKQKYKIFSC